MPHFTDIATSVLENVASATVNYSISVAIGPFVGPVGAALAPSALVTAAPTILTSATSSLITLGIFASGKTLASNMLTANPNSSEKPLSEEWDDADVALIK